MSLQRSRLPDEVVHRTLSLEADGQNHVRPTWTLSFAHPLPTSLREQIAAEAAAQTNQAANVIKVEAEDGHSGTLLIRLGPIDPQAVRLDVIVRVLSAYGSPVGAPHALYIMGQVATMLNALRNSKTPARGHGLLQLGHILIGPDGTIHMLDPSLPTLSPLLIPKAGASPVLRSPEAAREEEPHAGTDVFIFTLLYCQLLCGRSLTEELGRSSTRRHLLGFEPWPLPAVLPDRRNALLKVLGRGLSPDPDDRYPSLSHVDRAIAQEAQSAGQHTSSAEGLARLLEAFIPRALCVGANGLAFSVDDEPALEQALFEEPSFEPLLDPAPPWDEDRTPVDEGLPGSLVAKSGPDDDWAEVLGVALDRAPSEPAREIPSEAETRSLDLPPIKNLGADPSRSAVARLSLSTDLPESPPANPLSALSQTALPPPKKTTGSATSKTGRPRIILAWAGVIAAFGLLLAVLNRGPTPETEPQPQTHHVKTPVAKPPLNEPHPKPIPVRTRNRKKRSEPKEHLLTVISTPSGATVELDGGFIGQTPVVIRHRFEPRVYRIAILRDGYRRWEKSVRPDPNRPSVSITAVLVEE